MVYFPFLTKLLENTTVWKGIERQGTLSELLLWATVSCCVSLWRPGEHNQSGVVKLDMPIL